MKYQDDVLDAVYKSAYNGGHIIELGLFKGGLSVQLAYLSKKLGVDLILVDISKEYYDTTLHHLRELGLFHDKVRLIHGTVEDLYAQIDCTYSPPAAIVVDALHTYNGVRTDISTILSYSPSVPVVAFHDFGLRSNYAKARENNLPHHVNNVDRAILDVISNYNALHPIGEYGKGGCGNVDNNFSYIKKNLPEGVLLFPELLTNQAFMTAYSYCAFANTVKDINGGVQQSKLSNVYYAVKHSRWIKLGKKLGFLKGLDIT